MGTSDHDDHCQKGACCIMNTLLDSWRPGFHLSPPDGWMSDPAGLCRMKGIYHVFYEYVPEDAHGKGVKVWGHFAGRSLTDLHDQGTAFVPTDYEKTGIYPGSALIDEDGMHLFYTGNVKRPGQHDFDVEGRISSQMRIDSLDGIHFEGRRCLLSNEDYPKDLKLKIRGPKVWREKDCFFMILAAGTRADLRGSGAAGSGLSLRPGNGCALLYMSRDLDSWRYLKELYIPDGFGSQWECPDYFTLGSLTLLSVCPQGLEHEQFRFQNRYSSGYFSVTGETRGGQLIRKDSYTEWDSGFDFYAPQTFLDDDGRRIMIAWAGMPDAEYRNLTIDKEGWQGLLTVPREITFSEGKVLQNPVKEILALRDMKVTPMNGEAFTLEDGIGEVLVGGGTGDIRVRIGSRLQPRVVTIEYSSGIVTMTLSSSRSGLSAAARAAAVAEGAVSRPFEGTPGGSQSEKTEAAGGRTVRRAKIGELRNMRILVDRSVLEVFFNDGETVMTTRYYPDHKDSRARVISAEYGLRSCQSWQYRRMADPLA